MKYNSFLIASVAILIGMGAITVSCKKKRSSEIIRKAVLIKESSVRAGEDDEDPVIQGKVKKKHTFVPVDSAFVEAISTTTWSTVSASYADSLGDFKNIVPVGNYYFRITVPGDPLPFVTSIIRIPGDTQVTILVD